jgi:hypothetical protein
VEPKPQNSLQRQAHLATAQPRVGVRLTARSQLRSDQPPFLPAADLGPELERGNRSRRCHPTAALSTACQAGGGSLTSPCLASTTCAWSACARDGEDRFRRVLVKAHDVPDPRRLPSTGAPRGAGLHRTPLLVGTRHRTRGFAAARRLPTLFRRSALSLGVARPWTGSRALHSRSPMATRRLVDFCNRSRPASTTNRIVRTSPTAAVVAHGRSFFSRVPLVTSA